MSEPNRAVPKRELRMGMTIRTALLTACMAVGSQLALTQDQEEGPVELAPTPDEVSPPPAQASASASTSGSFDNSSSSGGSRAARGPERALRVYGGFRLGVGGGVKSTDPDEDFL